MYINLDEIKEEFDYLTESLQDRWEEISYGDNPITDSEYETWKALEVWKNEGDLSIFPVDSNLGRYNQILDLLDEIGLSKDSPYWDDCGPMIHESDWIDYVQEFASDIGAINEDHSWPNYCVDWDKAASELAYDYSKVEWEGNNYYVRAI